MRPGRPEGFSLIEVIAALAIVSIALLGLLELHLVSMNVADRGQAIDQAVFLAQERMAEVLCAGRPPLGTKSDVVESNGSQFTRRTEVTDVQASLSRQLAFRPRDLRRVTVDVTWQKKSSAKSVRLTTYVAESRIRAK